MRISFPHSVAPRGKAPGTSEELLVLTLGIAFHHLQPTPFMDGMLS